MNSKKLDQKSRILIELDALIDTRLGTVRKLYPEVAEDLKMSKRYRMRRDDLLHRIDPRIDEREYQLAYDGRDIETLDVSFSSLMIGYVHKLLAKLQTVIDSNNPVIQDAQLVINTYPYRLSEDQVKMIAIATATAIGTTGVIDTVYRSPGEVTLDWLETNGFLAYILYDFNMWTMCALPDHERHGGDIASMGLRRYENLTIFAARVAKDADLEDQSRKEFSEYGMGEMYDEMITLPWNLLFELEFLEPMFYTEYNQELADHIMSFVEKSNSPIDLEVGLIADFYHLLGLTTTTKSNIIHVTKRMTEVAMELSKLTSVTSKDDIDRMRMLIAEQRFLTDSLSYLMPSQPALDFERFMDSNMSKFDVTRENSDISENKWNSLGVPCRRIVRNVKTLGHDAFILVVAEDCTDLDGVFRAKNTLLPSVMCFAPILEAIPTSEVDEFLTTLTME